MRPTNSWLCDSCGQLIKKAAHGVVEWVRIIDENGQWRGHRLQLVHCGKASPSGPNRCGHYYEACVRKDDMVLRQEPLGDLLGAKNLPRLLSVLAQCDAPVGQLFDMIQRLNISSYEHARPHFHRAIAHGIIGRASPDGYYTQHDIQAVLEFANSLDSPPSKI